MLSRMLARAAQRVATHQAAERHQVDRLAISTQVPGDREHLAVDCIEEVLGLEARYPVEHSVVGQHQGQHRALELQVVRSGISWHSALLVQLMDEAGAADVGAGLRLTHLPDEASPGLGPPERPRPEHPGCRHPRALVSTARPRSFVEPGGG